jgi:hypothetical protein
LTKKNRQFLAKPAGVWYCFSEMTISQVRTSRRRHATGPSASKAGNDSGMAPQTVENAQNRLGDPPAHGLKRAGADERSVQVTEWIRRKSAELCPARRRQAQGAGAPCRTRRGNHRRSGGTASLASASSACSAPIAACALEPSRRKDTVFSLASFRPRAIRTGTFANECSRTL